MQNQLEWHDFDLDSGSSGNNGVLNAQRFKYDVFFCHASKDRAWVCALVDKLESDEYNFKCCFDDRDFIPGRPVVDNINRSIRNSKKTVIVLSPNFLSSNWCSYEVRMTLEIHVDSQRNLFIPLVIEHCQIPNYVGKITYIDAEHESYLERLVIAIKDADYNDENKLLSTHQLSNVPIYRNTFKIKEVVLQANYHVLQNNENFLPYELNGKINFHDVYKRTIKQFKQLRLVKLHNLFRNNILFMLVLFNSVFPFILIFYILPPHYYSEYNILLYLPTLAIINLCLFIYRLVDGFIQYRSIRRLLIESNFSLHQRNVMVAFLEYSSLNIGKIKTSLIFYDYNWQLCISSFHNFISDLSKLPLDDLMMNRWHFFYQFPANELSILEVIFDIDENCTNINRIVNYLYYNEVAEKNVSKEMQGLFPNDKDGVLKMLLDFVPMYTDLLARDCLDYSIDSRHVKGRLCLCQFAELYFFQKLNEMKDESRLTRFNRLLQTKKFWKIWA